MLRRLSGPAAVLAAALLVGTAAGPASAAPDPGPVPQLTVPGSHQKARAFQALDLAHLKALPAPKGASGSTLDPAAAASAGSRLTRAAGAAAGRSLAATQSFTCDEVIDKDARVGQDESGAQVLRVAYYGDVLCNFYLIEGAGVAAVVDHTPGNAGQFLDIGTGYDFQEYYYGFSQGDFEILGDTDPRARSIEVIEEVYLLSEIPWGPCGPLAGLQYYLCDGVGGNLLHIIVGTGPFPTGLQDPPALFLGQGQGQGCPVTLSATAKNKRTVPINEHVVDVDFAGTIACSPGLGITGTSQARLVDLSAPVLDVRAGDSGANGSSAKTVTYRESGKGGRTVKVVYSGRTEAPPGRAWSGCAVTDFETARYLFTQCQVSGNVITWQAEAPFPDFVGDGAKLDTGLPPDRQCEIDRALPTVDFAENQLVAKGFGRCNAPIGDIEVTLTMSGSYVDNSGTRIDVVLPFGGEIIGRDTDIDDPFADGSADAVLKVDCQEGNPQQVDYKLSIRVRFKHTDLPPGSGWPSAAGWEQVLDLPEPPEESVTTMPCVPV